MIHPLCPLTFSYIHSISADFSSTSLCTMGLSYRESIPRSVKQTSDFHLLHTIGRQQISEEDDTNNSGQQGKQSNYLPLGLPSVQVKGPRMHVVSGSEWNFCRLI